MNLRTIATAALAATISLGAAGALAPTASAADLPAPTVAAAPAATTTTGSVKVDLTVGSVEITGTKSVSVACTVKGKTYTVVTKKTTVDGYQVYASMVIRNYTGPGSYTGTVSMGVKGANVAAAGAVTGVKVTITETGGVFAFSKTGTGTTAPKLEGKTISGSMTYTCNS